MDKFGVDEETDTDKMEKAAANGCPRCGAAVKQEGRLLICPRCGTEPFESPKK